MEERQGQSKGLNSWIQSLGKPKEVKIKEENTTKQPTLFNDLFHAINEGKNHTVIKPDNTVKKQEIDQSSFIHEAPQVEKSQPKVQVSTPTFVANPTGDAPVSLKLNERPLYDADTVLDGPVKEPVFLVEPIEEPVAKPSAEHFSEEHHPNDGVDFELSKGVFLLRVQEAFALKPMASTVNVRYPDFFEPIKVNEKYLYILNGDNQEDVLKMQFARFGITDVEYISPFSNKHGIDLFEMEVRSVFESMFELLLKGTNAQHQNEVRQVVSNTLLNHLYVLKLTDHYQFNELLNAFNDSQSFYNDKLEVFLKDYSLYGEGFYEFQVIAQSLVTWFDEKYELLMTGMGKNIQPLFIAEGANKGKQKVEYKKSEYNELLFNFFNSLQTDMVVKKVFDNEQNVPILKTLTEKNVVVVQLDPLYFKKYKHSYETVITLLQQYLMYIKCHYQGEQTLNIISFYDELK